MISPRLDPSGKSLVHRASPVSKLFFLFAVTLVATLDQKLSVELALSIESAWAYWILARGKTTPPPPIFRIVLGIATLLFALNVGLAGSALGRWGGIPLAPGSYHSVVPDAGTKALRVAATSLSLIVLTLSTIPRDLARRLERLRLPVWFTETLAIALRFLPLFEINLRMLLRSATVQFTFGQGRGRRSFLQIRRGMKDLLVSIIVMALSQASITAQSLELRGFDARRKRSQYLPAFDLVASLTFWTLGLVSLSLPL